MGSRENSEKMKRLEVDLGQILKCQATGCYIHSKSHIKVLMGKIKIMQ